MTQTYWKCVKQLVYLLAVGSRTVKRMLGRIRHSLFSFFLPSSLSLYHRVLCLYPFFLLPSFLSFLSKWWGLSNQSYKGGKKDFWSRG